MRKTCLLLITLLIAMTGFQHARAQKVQQKTMTFGAGEIVFLPGIGAIVKESDGKLVVEFAPPADRRSKEYKNVDIKTGDRILMCNGKRVETVEDLRNIIDSLEIGNDIALGIRRDKRMMMTSFVKAESNTGGQPMMVMTQEIGGEGDEGINFDVGGSGEIIAIPPGIVITEKDKSIIIAQLLPDAADNIKGDIPEKGDVIVSVNGTNIKSIDDLDKAFESVNEGKTISLELSRDGKKLKTSFTKSFGKKEVVVD